MMFYCPFHTIVDVGSSAHAFIADAFDTHQSCIRSHACFGSGGAVAAYSSCTVCSVTELIHRVVVVFVCVITVMWELCAAVPEVVGEVNVVVVDARVDDGN